MQIWWRERFAKFSVLRFGSQARTEFEVREIFDDMGQVTWKGSGNRVNAKRWQFQLMLRVDNIAFAQSFIFIMVYGSPNVIWLKFCDVRCCIQVWVFSVLCWIDGEILWFQIQKGVSWTTLVVHPAGTETFIAILWEDSPSQEPSWIAATRE